MANVPGDVGELMRREAALNDGAVRKKKTVTPKGSKYVQLIFQTIKRVGNESRRRKKVYNALMCRNCNIFLHFTN